MGKLALPPVSHLLRRLRDRLLLSTCIETGTYVGQSADTAATIFDHVITMETREECVAAARKNCAAHSNIEFHLGDSRALLPAIVDRLTKPALFFLDGHNSRECPLLEELDIIRRSPLPHCILIDDLWMFALEDPQPWPCLKDVMAKIDHQVVKAAHDLIVCVPPEAADLAESFSRSRVLHMFPHASPSAAQQVNIDRLRHAEDVINIV